MTPNPFNVGFLFVEDLAKGQLFSLKANLASLEYFGNTVDIPAETFVRYESAIQTLETLVASIEAYKNALNI